MNDYVFDNFKWDHCEGKIEDDSDDDEVATTYATNTVANRMHESLMKSQAEEAAANAAAVPKTTSTYGAAVQESFTLWQAGIAMSVVVCVVMLFTWIQFTLNIRSKSEGTVARH